MLKIENLKVKVQDKEIIKGLSLDINPGEVHAIMGPNGAGKSTLSYTLAGKEGYEVTDGHVDFKGHNLLNMSIDERANNGLFLAFQYPVEIEGVTNNTFLRMAINSKRKFLGEKEMNTLEFMKALSANIKDLHIHSDMGKRGVNSGFSGGEKKRNEVLQMTMLQPDMIIMDETDSGLDIDALREVADGVNRLRSEGRSFLIITHYQRLLDYIQPDFIHVLADGKITKTGDKNLALELEETGYKS
ncbi:MAG: Fe-S cluster assembly ATPase SufC [Alphaproteobacteria bacterium]|jgi:Fe-S cluster assembly ATP-binding protein|nr:Fe-S cluster assembly ATPase SufC [Alphaproteobacteria bacterium]